MGTKRLILTFMDTTDKKISFSLDDPKPDLTESQVKAAMDLVVAKNIFVFNGANLAKTSTAQVVETTTTEFDLVL